MQNRITKTECPQSLKLTIYARPCSKKNSRRVFMHKYTHRMMNLPSEAYDNFKAVAIPQIKQYMYDRDFHIFDKPVMVDYVFYRKGKLKQDVDNSISSINDIMQDAGLLLDDDLIQRGTFNRYSGCDDWKTEVTITPIATLP